MAQKLQPASALFTTSLFLSALWGSAVAQGLPPSTLFGTGNQICNYQYAIPNGGNCVTFGPALEQKLDAVQRDVDRAKMQYVSQNTIILELRRQNADKDAKISDLTKDLKSLEATVNSLQTTVATNTANIGKPSATTNNNNNNPNNAALVQLVTSTQKQLAQDLNNLENKLNTAVAAEQQDRQKDAVQQSRVDTAFQAQIREQQRNLTSFLRTQQQLQIDVINLQLAVQRQQQATPSAAATTKVPVTTTPPPTTSTSASTTTTTAAPVVTSPAGPTTPNPVLQQLMARVQKLEKDYQTDIPPLKTNFTYLLELSKNQTLVLSDVKAEADSVHFTEIPKLQAEQQTAHGEITSLFQRMTPLENQVQKIAANVSSLTGQIIRVASDTITQKVQLKGDEVKISDLTVQVGLLARKYNTLQSYLHLTTAAPPSTTSTTFAVPTIPHSGGKTTAFKIPTLGPANG